MGSTTLRSLYTTRVDALLQGIGPTEYTAANRLLALDTALARYSQDFRKLRSIDIPGDSGNYYVLYGQIANVLNSTQDASVDFATTGGATAGTQFAASFTLPYRMEVHAVRFLLKRTGSPVGTLACEIRLPGTNVPSTFAAQTSASLDPDVDLPLGFEAGKTEFRFASPTSLDAGTYYATLVPTGYTLVDGTTEIVLGVDQSSVTNTLFTFDDTTWTAFGTDSAVIIEVLAALPGWHFRWSHFRGADIPAATISLDEVPTPLEDEDMEKQNQDETEYLYLPNNAPTSAETIRLSYAAKYSFTGTPSVTDVPEAHREAVSQLGAHYVCTALAAGYGQNIDSGHTFDITDRRNQSDVYASRAKNFLNAYAALLGIELAEEGGGDTTTAPAFTLGDLDRETYSPRDFLFHGRRKR